MSKFIQKVSCIAEKQLLIEMKKQAFWQLGEQRDSLCLMKMIVLDMCLRN